jgi:hypothetical protein
VWDPESPYVTVTGSLAWRWYEPIYRRLAQLPRGTVIVHGDAGRGGDRFADMAADQLGFECIPFPADWSVREDTPLWARRRRRDGEMYDVRAGHMRNCAMIDAYPPRLVLAFLLDGSGGTKHCIGYAAQQGIPVVLDERWSASEPNVTMTLW